MKVRFLQSVAGNGFHYRAGAVVELPSERANHFLNAKFCEAVAEAPKTRAKRATKKPINKETR